jgi:hypothetical protein
VRGRLECIAGEGEYSEDGERGGAARREGVGTRDGDGGGSEED